MEFIRNYQKTALIYEDEPISYEELIKNGHYYGSKLQVEEEERVLIFSPNRPDLVYAFLGIWSKKACVVISDYSNSFEELMYLVEDSKPKYIYTTIESKEKVEKVKNALNFPLEILYFEDNYDKEVKEYPEFIYSPSEDKMSLILYTSGTTGEPKGVMLSYGNIKSQVLALGEYSVFEKDDRFLALLPLHHIFPLLGSVIIPLYFGSTIVFLKELSTDKIIDALKKYKITILIGVPRLYELFHRGIMGKINSSKIAKLLFSFAKNFESQSFKKKLFKKVQDGFGGNIKFFVSGGAKLEPQIAKDFGNLGFSVLEGYGLTETSPMISFTRPKQIKPGSCGHVIPGVDLKFSEEGELLVKGPNVFKGYYNKPDKTKETFTEDGYFKTGDLGEINEEGFLSITGRSKEMIVLSNGKNINPLDIEKELMKLSQGLIEEVAILEHEKVLKAIVLPNLKKVAEMKIQNIQETIKWNIIDAYNTHAPKYKKILSLKLIKEELPKTKLGKLRRFKLPELFNEEKEIRKDFVEPSFEEYRILKEYLFKASKKSIYPDSHIELDLGFDSLEIVELNAFIAQNFGIKIDEETFSKNPTVEKLALILKERGSKKEEIQIDWKEVLKSDEDYKLPTSSIGLIKGKILGKILFNSYFRVKREGEINLPKEPFVLISNHQSFLDIFIIIKELPLGFLRKTYFMAKIKHFQKGFGKFLADNTNTIIVDINQNLGKTLKESAYALKKGKNMVIFPEGIRTRDGELNDFKKSFAILSKELGVPVIPVGIKGAYEAMPFGSIFPKPKKITVKFFDPIYPEKYSVDQIVETTRETINTWLKK